MKNFIEIATKNGKEFVNVNHILKVTKDDSDNSCEISFSIPNLNSPTVGEYKGINSTESYDDVVAKIVNAD